MTPNLTLDEFPPVSTAEWDEAVRRDLKGAAPRSKLYYRAEDLDGLDYLSAPPGAFPYTRGRGSNDWSIRQTAHSLAQAQAAVDAGAGEIAFVLGEQDVRNISDLLNALPACPMHFEAGPRAAEALQTVAPFPAARGSVDFEPLADFDRAAQLIAAVSSPDFKPLTIRAHRFSEAGATPVQELAFALAEGVDLLANLPLAAPAMAFSFAIGPEYFLEIARLRAARTLWARVVESFGGSPDAARMTLCARTAHWTTTVYDAHVNLLRATTQTMSAVIGGADAVLVEPFDSAFRAPDDAARRLALNTQLILKREAWLDRSVDPAGGAYYLEALTDATARDAWTLLRQIEAAGGFLKYSASGDLDRAIAQSRAARDTAAANRRASIVGTNQYPNPAERMLPRIERLDAAPRPARIFEDIRLRTERHAARTGHTPRLLLLESGDLKMRQARSAFAANFFACAGFETVISSTLDGDFDAVVLCSSDPEYAALAPRVIRELRDAGRAAPVIVAGHPADSIEPLRQAGVADFVHLRSHAAEVLRAWQERLAVKD